jgi:hypothetical protein
MPSSGWITLIKVILVIYPITTLTLMLMSLTEMNIRQVEAAAAAAAAATGLAWPGLGSSLYDRDNYCQVGSPPVNGMSA